MLSAQGLEQDLEKNSPTLGRSAVYHEATRISRLPSCVSVCHRTGSR